MTDLDRRDAILQALTPAVMVPRFGKLAPLAKNGHRYLLAADGLWLEVRRPWLHARVPLMFDQPHQLPFGRLEREIVYAFGEDELFGIQAMFVHDARKALPDEFAAWAVYDENTRRLSYRALLAEASSPGGLEGIQRPRLEPHESLAIDLHSHGRISAYFSATDDADDLGEVKLAVVAGRLHTQAPAWETRLCLLGLFIGPEDEALVDPEATIPDAEEFPHV